MSDSALAVDVDEPGNADEKTDDHQDHEEPKLNWRIVSPPDSPYTFTRAAIKPT
jgi:hypothetical protein